MAVAAACCHLAGGQPASETFTAGLPSSLAAMVIVCPLVSATATALANDNRRFIHSSPHCRHSCQAPWAIGGRGIHLSERLGNQRFRGPLGRLWRAPSGAELAAAPPTLQGIRRAAGSRCAIAPINANDVVVVSDTAVGTSDDADARRIESCGLPNATVTRWPVEIAG